MKIKFIKSLAILLLCTLFSQTSFSQTHTPTIDGMYTLAQIIDASGKINNFSYGGEITIKNSLATLKSKTQEVTWLLDKNNCDLSNNILYELNPDTQTTYIYEKTGK